MDALTDDRLNEYLSAVPNEWRNNNNAANKIIDYLREARENRNSLFAVLTHLLR